MARVRHGGDVHPRRDRGVVLMDGRQSKWGRHVRPLLPVNAIRCRGESEGRLSLNEGRAQSRSSLETVVRLTRIAWRRLVRVRTWVITVRMREWGGRHTRLRHEPDSEVVSQTTSGTTVRSEHPPAGAARCDAEAGRARGRGRCSTKGRQEHTPDRELTCKRCLSRVIPDVVFARQGREPKKLRLQGLLGSGAKGGIRTPTLLLTPAPQAGASASSATFARSDGAVLAARTAEQHR